MLENEKQLFTCHHFVQFCFDLKMDADAIDQRQRNKKYFVYYSYRELQIPKNFRTIKKPNIDWLFLN